MTVKAHMAMVINLDKCLGCHACSIPCKNTWAAKPGSEHIWLTHVETRPGEGYPPQWEDQRLYREGRDVRQGALCLLAGNRLDRLRKIFSHPHISAQATYRHWEYAYQGLFDAPPGHSQPMAEACSAAGDPMTPQGGPNWGDDLAGAHTAALRDASFADMDPQDWLHFKQVFMLHLPRMCEHCLNPACVAACPSGALHKREIDGVVLLDQARCRGWRFCVPACPYRKIFFNPRSHRAQKCQYCAPLLEKGQPPLCVESCQGYSRHMGIMLYDADMARELASHPPSEGLHAAHLSVFLNPHDRETLRQAEESGLAPHIVEAARRSPVYRLVAEWQLALPLHPEFNTLPMVWYIPPTSPMLSNGAREEGSLRTMRIPLRYLANLFAAGDEEPVRRALGKLLALRAFMRRQRFGLGAPAAPCSPYGASDGLTCDPDAATLSPQDARAMLRLLVGAGPEDCFVVPRPPSR